MAAAGLLPLMLQGPGAHMPPPSLATMQAFILVGTTLLTCRQVFCVLASLTTNELLLRDKYPYFQAPDHTFTNPFDEGPLTNCLTFWSGGPRPDWYNVYAARHAAAWAPRFSATAALRAWDEATAALRRARAARVRQQQDRLLAEYGGVRQDVLEARRLAEAEGGECGGGQCGHHTHPHPAPPAAL